MGRFGVYALYLVFNYYNNSDTNSTTISVIKTNIENNCNGALLDKNYKGIDCYGELPFLQCCQKNVNNILNKSVEMNTCLNYSNNYNYSNMIVDCIPNEHILFEYLIVVGFSIILVFIMGYIIYCLYKGCFRNEDNYSYNYLNINEDIGRRYL